MNTGELIAQLRNKNKISQSALANDLHIGQSTLAMYEKGKRNPNLEMISKIADYFNVTTDYLLGRDGKEENQEQNADLASDDVIFTYEGKPIPKEDLELIRRLMRGTRNDI